MKKRALLLSTILATSILGTTLVSPTPAQAQYPWEPGYDITSEYYNARDPATGPNQAKWFEEGTIWISKTIAEAVTGGVNPDTGEPIQTGLVSLAGVGVIKTLNNPPPVQTTHYLASINPFKVKPAYAQVPGTQILTLVLDLWKIVRNIAYLFMTTVMVAVGFMIMFRKEAEPRITVTLQMALPKIIIGLILVTFSYAISGLSLDIYHVLRRVIENILINNVKPILTGAGISDPFPVDYNILQVWTDFGVTDLIKLFSDPLQGNPLPGWSGVFSVLAGNFFQIAFGLALFSAMLKTLFKLITYYASFFILTLASPFAFLLGTVPGQIEVIGAWFKKIMAASLVFSALYLAMNLALYLKLLIDNNVNVPSAPQMLTGAGAGGVMARVIYYGILLSLPAIPELIENALSGEIRPTREGVDIGSAAKKIPFIGGFVA